MHNIHVNGHRRGNSHVTNYVRHGRTVNPNKHYNSKKVRGKIPPEVKFPEMISDIPNDPGVYGFYNDNDRALYVGSTKNLRKRIQSYEEQDHTHPTKVQLRNHISKVGYKEMPLSKAREIERELKSDTVYNYD